MPRPKGKKITSAQRIPAQPAATQGSTVDKSRANNFKSPQHDSRAGQKVSRGILQKPLSAAKTRVSIPAEANDDVMMSGALGALDSTVARGSSQHVDTEDMEEGMEARGRKRRRVSRQEGTEVSPVQREETALSQPVRAERQNIGIKRASRDGAKVVENLQPTASQKRDERVSKHAVAASPASSTTQALDLPPSAFKAQNTPSFISIANFKRRQRQPSILRMVQQSVANQSDNEGGHADFDEQDTTVLSLRDVQVIDPAFSSEASSVSSSTRKRKRTDTAITRRSSTGRLNRHELDETLPDSPNLIDYGQNGDVSRDFFAQDGENQTRGRQQQLSGSRRSSARQPLEEVTHQSRSVSPQLQRRQDKRKSKARAPLQEPIDTSATSPMSSPESPNKRQRLAAESPSAARRKPPARAKRDKRVTDAELRALLPRRKRRLHHDPLRDGFQILSSEASQEEASDEDGDELARRTSPKRRAAVQKAGKKAKANARKPLTKLGQRKGNSRVKIKTGTASKPLLNTKGTSRTYSRQEKENVPEDFGDTRSDDAPDDDDELVLVDREEARADNGKSKELADAAKKFAEVDDWELDFETCDVGGGSSSPWR